MQQTNQVHDLAYLSFLYTDLKAQCEQYQTNTTDQMQSVLDDLKQIKDTFGNPDQYVKKVEGKDLFSGNYNDLTNKPTGLSAFENDADYVKKNDLQGITFSGDYNDLTNKPTGLSSFTDDVGYVKKVPGKDLFSGDYADLLGVPTKLSDFLNDESFVKQEEGKGLFSGNYDDLTNKPTKVSVFENDANYATKDDLKNASFGGEYKDIKNAPHKLSDLENDMSVSDFSGYVRVRAGTSLPADYVDSDSELFFLIES